MPNDQAPGGGRPRLVVAPEGGHASATGPEALGYEIEFPLEPRRTTIGSGDDQDIVLEGLRPAHAVIEWVAEDDEFVFVPSVPDGTGTVDGNIATMGVHHGDRIQVGSWTLVFQRDETAEHVRPGPRARQGGEYGGRAGHSTETD